jgi:TP901 family phage tail tape measure protein
VVAKMAETVKGINVIISGETTGLSKALADVNKQSKNITSELKQVEKALKLDPKNTTLLAQKQKLLSDAIATTGEKLKRLKDAQKEVNEQFKAGKISEEQYRAFQRETIKTEGELKKLESQLKETGQAANKFSANMQNASEKLKNAGEKMKTLGTNMTTRVTVPLIAAGAAAVVAFNEVDDGMDTIIKKTGATGEAAKKLEKVYKDVGSSVPDQLGQVGAAIGEVNTRFDVNGDKLATMSKDFLKFARINDIDVNTSIQLVSRAMGDAGIESDQYMSILDMLTVAGQKSGVSMEDLTKNLAYYGAPMRALGIDTKTSIAMFAGWEKAGVNTEVAFSGMKKAIGNWGKQGKDSTKEFQKTLEAIKACPDLASATAMAIEIFGQKAGPDLADAIKGGRFEINDYMKALDKSGGAVQSTYKEIADGGDKIATAFNAIKIAGADFGGIIIETIAPALENLGNIISKVGAAFAILPSPMKKIILVIAGIIAAAGPLVYVAGNLVFAFGNLLPVLAKLKIFMTALNFSALISPIGLIIIAVVALAAAAYLIYKNWDKISAFFINLWNKIQYIFIMATEKIKTVLTGAWNSINAGVIVAWGVIKHFLVNWWPVLLGALAGPIGLLAGLIYKNWDKIKATTIAIWNNIKTAIATTIGNIKTVVVTGLEKAWTYIKGIPAKAIGWGKEIISGLISGITEKLTALWKTIGNIADGIKTRIKSALKIKSPSGVMEEFGRLIAEGLAQGIKKSTSKVNKAAAELTKKLVETVKSVTDTMIGKFDLLGSIAEKKTRLFELMGGAANIWDKFRMKKDFLTEQFSLVAKQVEVLTLAYNRLAKIQGAGSTDALEMQNKLLDMQIKLLETKKELEAITGQERRTRENARLLEQGAALAGGGKTVVNNITVNNPKQETAGDTIRQQLLRLQYLGAF